MGFNIGVWSEHTINNTACYHFIDRAFYNFINQGEQYGDQSILIRSGRYYGLDLSPLLKLVYISDELTQDYLKQTVQNTDELLNLVTSFRDSIERDNSVCDKINYVWYEQPIEMSEQDKAGFIKGLGEVMANLLLETMERKKKEIEQDPNPWKWYFEEKQIVSDLNNLIATLQCYKEKGVIEVYVTAG